MGCSSEEKLFLKRTEPLRLAAAAAPPAQQGHSRPAQAHRWSVLCSGAQIQRSTVTVGGAGRGQSRHAGRTHPPMSSPRNCEAVHA